MKKITLFQKKVARLAKDFGIDRQFGVGLCLMAFSYPLFFINSSVSLAALFAGFLVTVDFLLRKVP